MIIEEQIRFSEEQIIVETFKTLYRAQKEE